MAKVSNKSADLVGVAIINTLKPFEGRVKTLTYDNGKEFCGYAKIDDALNSTDYFARTFASWECSSNQNFNGLLRQYVPVQRLMESVLTRKLR
jgi:IS30 family transposase